MKYPATIISLLILSFSLLCGCRAISDTQTPYKSTEYAMGTVINHTIYAPSYAGKNLSESITDELNRLEKDYLSWRITGSAINNINNTINTGVSAMLDDRTASFMYKVLELSEASHGSFDPTIGKVIDLWGFYDNNPSVPDDAQIKKALSQCGISRISYNKEQSSLTATPGSDIKLDLGAAGKGIGCNIAYQVLDSSEPRASGAVISVGGSILVYGKRPDDKPWKIAITNPRNNNDNEYLGILRLSNTPVYISTSGDYEKYFEKDGIRYHHIIDPSTGYPAHSGLMSVTIVCDDGLISDALSTACFVMGIHDSLPLLERYNAEAVFVDTDKAVTVTLGLKNIFSLKSPYYHIKYINT